MQAKYFSFRKQKTYKLLIIELVRDLLHFVCRTYEFSGNLLLLQLLELSFWRINEEINHKIW